MARVRFVFLQTFLILQNVYSELTENDVEYYLSTKHNQQPVLVNPKDLSNQLDKSSVVIFLIHDYLESSKVRYYKSISDAIFSKADDSSKFNIIGVDWSKTANNINYFSAANDAKKLGKIIGNLISNLTLEQFSLKQFHLIGFSLGAQVCGSAGRTVSAALDAKIARITALDPISLGFEFLPDNLRKTDADLLVTFRTDGHIVGQIFRIGHIDIYVNGGYALQPGCPSTFGDETTSWQKIYDYIFCSHLKAPLYYAEAIKNPGTMMATQCSSYIAIWFGLCKNNHKIDAGSDDLTLDDSGRYYLDTK